MDTDNKINLFEPGTVVFFIVGFLTDLSFLAIIGIAIPGIGLMIAAFALGAHYFNGLIFLAYFWGKTQGFLPKAILILAWIVPLPLLTVGLILAIIMSNKLAAFLIEQVAIQALAVATAGGAEVLEAGAVAAEGAEVAVTAAEVAEAGVTATEVGAEGAEVGAQAAEMGTGASAEAGTEVGEAGAEETADQMAAREEANPMENLQKDLEEPPENLEYQEESKAKAESEEKEREEEAAEKKAKKRIEKVFDIADRRSNKPPQGSADDQNDEYSEAA